ncbi:hypothetical protein KIW84_066443 [Lathyrus oleraceus]|uniref:Uncharacterized protein n=1 Tax=Pisum sativum TaxID=3888 RepID=A0A9D4WHS4_PEA|nr:hypothetical protein KIW84_066443 [Pisum sativum]
MLTLPRYTLSLITVLVPDFLLTKLKEGMEYSDLIFGLDVTQQGPVAKKISVTGHLPGSPPPFLVVDMKEQQGFVQEYLVQEEVVMADKDFIGIANDIAHKIIDYVVFDPNSMNT